MSPSKEGLGSKLVENPGELCISVIRGEGMLGEGRL